MTNDIHILDLGNGSYVNADRIVSIASTDSLPVRRLIQDAKNAGRVIDLSGREKTRSVLVTDSEHVICSAEETSVLASRWLSLGAGQTESGEPDG
ncbi:MAG: DUF370 domain-containing protein, partial [Clostridia bacterium]|nr:DUF370 domain-containing protein [Clostridia bacterium]